MKYVLLTALLFITACRPQDTTFGEDGKITFSSFNNLPIVEGKINGKKAYFILDTGATISVLDANQSKDYNFEITTDDANNQAVGYGGRAAFFTAVGATVEVGGTSFETNYKAQDLSAIVKAVRQGEGVALAGIIGTDVMKPNKFTINFSDNSVMAFP